MTTSTREHELHQDIERTREQLGDTVQARVHKVDVPARVKDKVHDTKETVQAKVDEVKRQLHNGTGTLQDKAEEATRRARSLTNQALAKLPPPVAGRIEQVMETVRQRPVPAAAVALGALVLLRRVFRRSR